MTCYRDRPRREVVLLFRMEEHIHAMQEWVGSAGPWLTPLVGLACFLKYLLPPFPSDTIVVVAGALSGNGHSSASSLFAACMAGSLAGMHVDYLFGRWLDGRMTGAAVERGRRWLLQASLERVEAGFRRWGIWILLLHRVLPLARALVFVFAGMSRLGPVRTLLLGGISTAVVHAGLIWATGIAVRNLPVLPSPGEPRFVWVVVTGGVLTAAGLAFWRAARRRQSRTAPQATGPASG